MIHYFNYLFIALGGALGAVSRYLLSTWIYNRNLQVLPYGTLVVNVLGCFLLGVFNTLAVEINVISPHIRMMISIGLLGSFTTFSTFSLETFNIIKENNLPVAFINIGLSVFLGLLAIWMGTVLANFFSSLRERGDEIGEDYR